MSDRCQRNTIEGKIAKALKFSPSEKNPLPWSELTFYLE